MLYAPLSSDNYFTFFAREFLNTNVKVSNNTEVTKTEVFSKLSVLQPPVNSNRPFSKLIAQSINDVNQNFKMNF